MNPYEEIKQGERGAWIGLTTFVVLSAIKLASGYFFHSDALMADGFNNLTDIFASGAIIVGLRISRKPPDSEHTYGHFRAETVAVLVASFIMALVGFQVLSDSIRSLFAGHKASPEPVSAAVAGGSAVVLLVIYFYNRRLALRANSQALMATAKDCFTDAMVSIGACIGILGSELGAPWMDTAAAVGVGLLILKTAWDIFRDATYRLTDGMDERDLQELKREISEVNGVQRIKDLKGRLYGNRAFVDVVITVNPELSVTEGHEITKRVQKETSRNDKVMFTNVHVEPEAAEELELQNLQNP